MEADQFQATIRPEDLTHHSFSGNEELDVFSVIFGLERSRWLSERWDKYKLVFQVFIFFIKFVFDSDCKLSLFICGNASI